MSYPNAAEEGRAKGEAAKLFEQWAEQVTAFVSEVSLGEEEPLWTGPAADRFAAELYRDPGFSTAIRGLREAYLQTAHNLRKAERQLNRPENRNRV